MSFFRHSDRNAPGAPAERQESDSACYSAGQQDTQTLKRLITFSIEDVNSRDFLIIGRS